MTPRLRPAPDVCGAQLFTALGCVRTALCDILEAHQPTAPEDTLNATTTRTAPRLTNGTFYPAAPGARTITESRDLYIGGHRVSVTVYDNGTRVSLHVGTRTVYDDTTPESIQGPADLHTWATAYATTVQLTPQHTHTVMWEPGRAAHVVRDTTGARVAHASTQRAARAMRRRYETWA